MAKIPHAEEGQACPFNGQDTGAVCHKCPLWVQTRGINPNTGEPVDDWRCSFAWLPKLLIENSQMQRQTGAAVESFRNDTIKANELVLRAVAASAQAAQPQLLQQG